MVQRQVCSASENLFTKSTQPGGFRDMCPGILPPHCTMATPQAESSAWGALGTVTSPINLCQRCNEHELVSTQNAQPWAKHGSFQTKLVRESITHSSRNWSVILHTLAINQSGPNWEMVGMSAIHNQDKKSQPFIVKMNYLGQPALSQSLPLEASLFQSHKRQRTMGV